MIKFKDTSYNGFKKKISESQEKFKSIKTSGRAGVSTFMDKTIEKKYEFAISYYKKYILNNKNKSDFVNSFNKMIKESKGDITKINKNIYNLFISDNNIFKNILKNTKNMDLKNSSYIYLYNQVFELLNDKKMIPVFKLAFNTGSNDINNDGLTCCYVINIMWSILLFFTCYSTAIVNTELFNDIRTKYVSYENIIDTNLTDIVEEYQIKYKSFIYDIGYASLEIVSFFKSLQNPLKELSDSIKNEIRVKKEYIKNSKSKEDFDKYLFFNNESKTSYLVDRSFERGSEEFITVGLILIGSVIGLILLVNLIRMAIYKIAALKINIISLLLVESETIRMNVQELRERAERETDEKEKKRLLKIAEKQEKIYMYIEEKIKDARHSSDTDEYEVTEIIEDEDRTINQDNNDENSSSKDDDYEVIL